jgi:hypothetical protein
MTRTNEMRIKLNIANKECFQHRNGSRSKNSLKYKKRNSPAIADQSYVSRQKSASLFQCEWFAEFMKSKSQTINYVHVSKICLKMKVIKKNIDVKSFSVF